MSLYRSMGRGTWVVERVLCGLHVRKATGCPEHPDAMRVEAALLLLAKHGRRDLIEAFAQGFIRGPELAASVEHYGVSFHLTAERAVQLAPAVAAWLAKADLAPVTKRDYGYGFTALQRRSAKASVAELPALLTSYARRAKPVMFQRVKAAVQSFVSATVQRGQHSDLWRDVAAIKGRRPRRRQVGTGLPPAIARLVAETLAAQFGAIYGATWWTLCCSGMGRSELWRSKWKVQLDHLVIPGTKTAHRPRIVPLVATPVRPPMSDERFADALAAVGATLHIPKLTIYVGRRTWAHFLELANIPPSRQAALMGHSPKDVPGLYREHDPRPYLADDTKALRAVIGADPTYVRAVG